MNAFLYLRLQGYDLFVPSYKSSLLLFLWRKRWGRESEILQFLISCGYTVTSLLTQLCGTQTLDPVSFRLCAAECQQGLPSDGQASCLLCIFIQQNLLPKAALPRLAVITFIADWRHLTLCSLLFFLFDSHTSISVTKTGDSVNLLYLCFRCLKLLGCRE